MSEQRELTERENLVLHAVVHLYVTTAEAVGSRSIVRRYGLRVSPATVRNVMSDLEEAGYLQQLHTSSGRVPTDLGYRVYVDKLMGVPELSPAERARIDREFARTMSDANETMRQACQILALLTHHAGILETPDEGRALLRQIELMALPGGRVGVFLADNYGRVMTRVVQSDDVLRQDDLQSLSRMLNEHLRNVPCNELAKTMHEHMLRMFDESRRQAEKALHLLSLLPVNLQSRLLLEGASQLFEQPEFRDVERAREVFSLLEERERLAELLRARVGEVHPPRTSIVIGSEAQSPGLEEISLVASPYCVGDQQAGIIGILGPRRMPYPKLAALVDYMAAQLSRSLTRIAS